MAVIKLRTGLTSAILVSILLAGVEYRAAAQGGPTVTSVKPPAGTTAGGDGITVIGSGFVTGASVTIGGVATTGVTTVVDANTITATTPAGSAGPKTVVVTNPGGANGSLTNGYQYVTVSSFTNDPAVAGNTPIPAQQLTELRQAVDNMRQVAGLAAATWTDPALTGGSTATKADHVNELRGRFDEALSALGYSVGSYTDPSIPSNGTIPMKAVHIQELRDRLKEIPPFCTYTLTPRSSTPSGGGIVGSVSISTGSACDWLAAALDSGWLFLSGTSGTGNGTVNFSVQANPSTNGRSNTIQIADQSFPISQAGCTLSPSA